MTFSELATELGSISMSSSDTAIDLRVSSQILILWRELGFGPEWCKVAGTTLYNRQSVENWIPWCENNPRKLTRIGSRLGVHPFGMLEPPPMIRNSSDYVSGYFRSKAGRMKLAAEAGVRVEAVDEWFRKSTENSEIEQVLPQFLLKNKAPEEMIASVLRPEYLTWNEEHPDNRFPNANWVTEKRAAKLVDMPPEELKAWREMESAPEHIEVVPGEAWYTLDAIKKWLAEENSVDEAPVAVPVAGRSVEL